MINNNFLKATSAIKLLNDGITSGNKNKIIAAYDAITEDDSFTWDGLDVPFMEWDVLVDEANEILYENT
jgi:hypothetical protein